MKQTKSSGAKRKKSADSASAAATTASTAPVATAATTICIEPGASTDVTPSTAKKVKLGSASAAAAATATASAPSASAGSSGAAAASAAAPSTSEGRWTTERSATASSGSIAAAFSSASSSYAGDAKAVNSKSPSTDSSCSAAPSFASAWAAADRESAPNAHDRYAAAVAALGMLDLMDDRLGSYDFPTFVARCTQMIGALEQSPVPFAALRMAHPRTLPIPSWYEDDHRYPDTVCVRTVVDNLIESRTVPEACARLITYLMRELALQPVPKAGPSEFFPRTGIHEEMMSLLELQYHSHYTPPRANPQLLGVLIAAMKPFVVFDYPFTGLRIIKQFIDGCRGEEGDQAMASELAVQLAPFITRARVQGAGLKALLQCTVQDKTGHLCQSIISGRNALDAACTIQDAVLEPCNAHLSGHREVFVWLVFIFSLLQTTPNDSASYADRRGQRVRSVLLLVNALGFHLHASLVVTEVRTIILRFSNDETHERLLTTYKRYGETFSRELGETFRGICNFELALLGLIKDYCAFAIDIEAILAAPVLD